MLWIEMLDGSDAEERVCWVVGMLRDPAGVGDAEERDAWWVEC